MNYFQQIVCNLHIDHPANNEIHTTSNSLKNMTINLRFWAYRSREVWASFVEDLDSQGPFTPDGTCRNETKARKLF